MADPNLADVEARSATAIDPNDSNQRSRMVRDFLWDSVVAQNDPNHQNAHANLPAYEFGHVKFYQKKNPYNDSEPMVGSQGGAAGSREGWIF